jgi:poly-beta-hydroxybutyrate-responsive repressor
MNDTQALKAASIQYRLGSAYSALLQGDRTSHLRHGIACYEAALQVYTFEAFPKEWAAIQHDLGNAYRDIHAQDRERAITCYQNALQVYTREAFPVEWAAIQRDLGDAYHSLSRESNLKAIACYEAALQVSTFEKFPTEWASIQHRLGNTYRDGRVGNLMQASACYQSALQIYTHAAFPREWAALQHDLGNAYRDLSSGDVEQAIVSYEASLQVFTRDAFPHEWMVIQHDLSNAYFKGMQYEKALDAVEQALDGNFYFALAHFDRGNALYGLKRYSEALEAYEQAIRLDPYNAAFYESEAGALSALGRSTEALEAYEQAIQLDESNPIYPLKKSQLQAELRSDLEKRTPKPKTAQSGTSQWLATLSDVKLSQPKPPRPKLPPAPAQRDKRGGPERSGTGTRGPAGYREGGGRGPGGYRESEYHSPAAYRVGGGLSGTLGQRPRQPMEGGPGRGPRPGGPGEPRHKFRPGEQKEGKPLGEKKARTSKPPTPPKPKKEKIPPPEPFKPTPEQITRVEERYLELAVPTEFDGIRTQISKELNIPKTAVKKIVKELRDRQGIPSWWELQTYKGSPEELEKIKALYEPLLPVPEIGIHEKIAEELSLKPATVYQAIKAIRLEMNLPQYNDPALHGLEFPPKRGDGRQQPQPEQTETIPAEPTSTASETDAWSKNWLVPSVLLVLHQWNSYGYELMEKMSTFGLETMNAGTFYRTLRQMEKDGMVSSHWDTSEGGPARRIYSITDAGEAYLKFWASSLDHYQKMMNMFFQLSTGQPPKTEKKDEQ